MASVVRGTDRSVPFLSAIVLGIVAMSAGVSRAGTVLFVVAERPGAVEQGDSFVLPLSVDSDIAHARDLIARGPDDAGAPIVFAEVSAGADGINRDVLAPGGPAWSWHVSAFEGFGDIGIELIDGNPTLLEEDVAGWILNTRRDESEATGHIGFWNYTVVAELDAPAVPVPVAIPTGLVGMLAVVVARGWRGTPWGKR